MLWRVGPRVQSGDVVSGPGEAPPSAFGWSGSAATRGPGRGKNRETTQREARSVQLRADGFHDRVMGHQLTLCSERVWSNDADACHRKQWDLPSCLFT